MKNQGYFQNPQNSAHTYQELSGTPWVLTSSNFHICLYFLVLFLFYFIFKSGAFCEHLLINTYNPKIATEKQQSSLSPQVHISHRQNTFSKKFVGA